jgi:hypothetical protein
MTFAEDLSERYPASAKMFVEMAAEEEGHRHTLLNLYKQRFGSTLPPIRREDVKRAELVMSLDGMRVSIVFGNLPSVETFKRFKRHSGRVHGLCPRNL